MLFHIDTALAVHKRLLREERPEAKKDPECRRAPSFNRGFISEVYKKREQTRKRSTTEEYRVSVF